VNLMSESLKKIKTGVKPLFRPRNGRIIFGVCAAFANRYGFDNTLTRAVYVIGTLLSGIFPGLLIYGVLWLFIPQEPLSSKSIVVEEDVDFEN
tara:strand:+ start:127 stop:405 length:279 start_codon:yes stop_codon:yes gene_type:complete